MRNVGVRRITITAMLSAAAVVTCLLSSFFSGMSLSLAAFAGAFSAVAMICVGYKYAWLGYVVTTVVLWLFLPNKECAAFYTVLFGHYPITKLMIEKIGKRFFVWLVKILEYSVLLVVLTLILRLLTGVWFDGKNSWCCMYMIAFFVMFILYDIAIGRMSLFFVTKLSKNKGFH